MAIPESQLETWSHQGSVTQSSETYQTIKRALESPLSLYSEKSFEVFLQGSYGNDTNIYAESDVDVVIRLDSIMTSDLDGLSDPEKAAYNSNHSAATYTFDEFKRGVVTRLETAFGNEFVDPGNKAIQVLANGSRRKADVVVCYQFRRYTRYVSETNNDYYPGIIFPTGTQGNIRNYPKLHSKNCTDKHQATNEMFKPMVRIFKNMRSKLVEDGAIAEGTAPSYFIEGLLYNAPNELFSGSYANATLNILRWLHQTTDRTKFVCANERYYLMRDNEPVCWPTASGNEFIRAVVNLWDQW